MTSKRRILLIFISVASGSLISVWIIKKRMGTLTPDVYIQLGFNFIFAVAIVVGVALLLQFMNKKDKEAGKNQD
jgi:MFS-type transporter involved in bile tolerance (Atg22 family)